MHIVNTPLNTANKMSILLDEINLWFLNNSLILYKDKSHYTLFNYKNLSHGQIVIVTEIKQVIV